MCPEGFSRPLKEMINCAMQSPDFKHRDMSMLQNGLTNFTGSEMMLALYGENYQFLWWRKAEHYLKEGVNGTTFFFNLAKQHQQSTNPNPGPSKQTNYQSKYDNDLSNNTSSKENQTYTSQRKTQTGRADKLSSLAELHYDAQPQQQASTKQSSSKTGNNYVVKLKHFIKFAKLRQLGMITSVRGMIEKNHLEKQGMGTDDICKNRLKVFPKTVGAILTLPETYYRLSSDELPSVIEYYDEPIQKYLDACYEASDVKDLTVLKWDTIKKKKKEDETLYGKAKTRKGSAKKKNKFIDLDGKKFKKINLSMKWPGMFAGLYKEGYDKS